MFHVDLAARREANLAADLAFARPSDIVLPDGPLTLSDAVRIGMENNLDLRVSRLLEEISSETARAEKLRLLPQFNVRADANERNNFPINEFMDMRTGDVALSNTISRERNQKTLEARLTWNLLDFGLSYYRARQAAAQTEISRMERRRQAQALARDIASTYWRSVLAEKNLAFIREMAEGLEQFRATAEGMVAERRLDPIFAKDIERQMASLAIQASDLQAQISGVRIELSRLMGIGPGTPFDLAGVDLPAERPAALPDPGDLRAERLEELSLRNRLELYAADLRENVFRDEARAALVSMFPGLRLDAAFSYDDNKFLVNNSWYSAGAGLAYDLLALPSRHATWRARLKGVERVEVDRLVTAAGILTQVHIALHDYRVRERQHRLRERSYEVYRDLLEMTRERNRAGMRGFPDTVVTQRMMENVVARLERDRALVNLMDAYYTLLTALGLDSDRWIEGGIVDFDAETTPPGDESQAEKPPEGGWGIGAAVRERDRDRFSSPLQGASMFETGDSSPGTRGADSSPGERNMPKGT